ncbi:alcohol dehydrogenase catalytic domain-containing protein [Rhizobium brockwellii]
MRAVRLESIGSLTMRSVEKPVAGPGELLVRVAVAGICGSDRHMYKGEYPTAIPVTLGHEFCGIVEEIGDTVTRFTGGELVTVDPNISCGTCRACTQARPNLCESLDRHRGDTGWRLCRICGGAARASLHPAGRSRSRSRRLQ